MNFDLLFYKQGERTLLRVIDSPGGQAQGQVTGHLPDLEMMDTLTQLREHPGRVTVNQIKQFGRGLFQVLFTDQDIYGCYQRSLHLKTGESLRIMLRLNDVPELSELPWEYLYDDDVDSFVALSTRTPLVRYIEVPTMKPSIRVETPLRILLVISNPTDYPSLDVQAEQRRVAESLKELTQQSLVEIMYLDTATLKQLRNALRENSFHIIHFIGHGDYVAASQRGGLLFEAEDGTADQVTAEALGTHLNDHRSLQLVLLNACEGARSSRTHLFAGVGQKLVQQGVPAAIAMQFPLTDKSALVFSSELYSALVDGYTIEASITEARKAIESERENVEWGTPVLFTRLLSAPLVEVAQESEVQIMSDNKPTTSSSSKTNIEIGGNNSGDINVSDGDINIDKRVDNRQYNIGSIGGDFVGGDQIISGDKTQGEKLTDDNSVAYLNSVIERVLNQSQATDLDGIDQEDLKEALEDLKEEVQKEAPSEKRLDRILRRIELIGPFAVEIIVNSLLNPGAAVADRVRAGVQAFQNTRK